MDRQCSAILKYGTLTNVAAVCLRP